MPNPTLQADRYDPDGDYVRRYVEELRDIPGRAVHQPWRLTPAERPATAKDYPDPIVDTPRRSKRSARAAAGVDRAAAG